MIIAFKFLLGSVKKGKQDEFFVYLKVEIKSDVIYVNYYMKKTILLQREHILQLKIAIFVEGQVTGKIIFI